VSVDDKAPARARSAAATALLPRFIEHRRRDVAAIHAALERGDFATIGRLGHNMSGNGVSYGFPEISAIGGRIEAAALAGNEMVVREQLAALDACLVDGHDGDAMEAAPGSESSTRLRAATADAEGIYGKAKRRRNPRARSARGSATLGRPLLARLGPLTWKRQNPAVSGCIPGPLCQEEHAPPSRLQHADRAGAPSDVERVADGEVLDRAEVAVLPGEHADV
jgi:HPt (histidine-containing phosphotransfer) domain-containing protein